MSGANYEYCPVCDRKALYVGEDDIQGVVVIHEACLEQEREAVAAREREACAQLADEHLARTSDDSPFSAILRAEGDTP